MVQVRKIIQKLLTFENPSKMLTRENHPKNAHFRKESKNGSHLNFATFKNRWFLKTQINHEFYHRSGGCYIQKAVFLDR